MQERIHKILAHAGYGSRRACEEIIAEGRITINGRQATVGDKADPQQDDLRIDGQRVRPEQKVYYILNKPTGYLSTNSDPMGRRKVLDLLPGVPERVYPVGRLDADSRGLVLMTNDGELADLLTHPSHEVPKTYEVEVDGSLSGEQAEKLMTGVWLSDGRTAPARIKLLRRSATRTLLEITLREGRNRQVRRMLARLGHKVRSLSRTRIGNLSLRGLAPGKFRPLTEDELASLIRMARSQAPEKTKAKAGGATARKRRAAGRHDALKSSGAPADQQRRKGPPADKKPSSHRRTDRPGEKTDPGRRKAPNADQPQRDDEEFDVTL